MRNRILGAIGVIWGFMTGGPQGAGAYKAGQTGALVFGVLLMLVGGYTLVKGGRKAG
jgi:hypothetical protein